MFYWWLDVFETFAKEYWWLNIQKSQECQKLLRGLSVEKPVILTELQDLPVGVPVDGQQTQVLGQILISAGFQN